jgi:hypothetical protein
VDEAKEIVGEFAFATQHHVNDAASRRHDVNPIELTGLVIFEQDGHHGDHDTNSDQPNDIERLPTFEFFSY